ncbi:MAG TPA: EutN/CcmL family microcompartment protein [Candidatus Saccharimonadales bacterium]|nr:EutN/CcmL family microcompartment protein [Candidatus Saccharimonadales bacterium]
MILGEVIGTVVSTRKEERLQALKLLLVREVDLDLKPTGNVVVAVDAVQAGSGEVVLCASGSSARLTDVTKDKPVDCVIMAIVDSFEVGGKARFTKSASRA